MKNGQRSPNRASDVVGHSTTIQGTKTYFMLRSVLSRHIVQKNRISLQFSSIRLMTVKKEDQEVATSTPLALPAAGDSESVPTTEVNSSFKLSELGPVGNVSILVSLHSIYAPMYLISRISSVFNCSYQRKWNHVPY